MLSRLSWLELKDTFRRLSLREREILRMVASGYTSTEVGSRLLISAMTVKPRKQ